MSSNTSILEILCVRAIAILAFAAIAIAAIIQETNSGIVQMALSAIVTIIVYNEYRGMKRKRDTHEEGEK